MNKAVFTQLWPDGVGMLYGCQNPLISGMPILPPAEYLKCKELAHAVWEAWQRLGKDADIDAVAERAGEIFEARMRAQQTLRQKRTLQRLLDAIVWDWDNPYLDPGDWEPLEE